MPTRRLPCQHRCLTAAQSNRTSNSQTLNSQTSSRQTSNSQTPNSQNLKPKLGCPKQEPGHAWNQHGTHVGHAWDAHGNSMGYAQDMHKNMRGAWYLHEMCMGVLGACMRPTPLTTAVCTLVE
eukprot:6927-Chlamydomonas_euryale.AAC.2